METRLEHYADILFFVALAGILVIILFLLFKVVSI